MTLKDELLEAAWAVIERRGYQINLGEDAEAFELACARYARACKRLKTINTTAGKDRPSTGQI